MAMAPGNSEAMRNKNKERARTAREARHTSYVVQRATRACHLSERASSRSRARMHNVRRQQRAHSAAPDFRSPSSFCKIRTDWSDNMARGCCCTLARLTARRTRRICARGAICLQAPRGVESATGFAFQFCRRRRRLCDWSRFALRRQRRSSNKVSSSLFSRPTAAAQCFWRRRLCID